MKYLFISLLLYSPFLLIAQSCPDCYDPALSCYNTPACVFQRMEGDMGGTPTNCNDGIDNDGDGLTDCEEPSCNCAVSNTEICNDGIDNDGDGLIDCQDWGDCEASTSCESDCSNGIDDDGDGFFDYYDGDCLATPSNPNNYIIGQTDCEATPTGDAFNIRLTDYSDNLTSAALGMPMVADVDNDGTPEVITTNSQTGDIYILNGSDLAQIKYQESFGSRTWAYPAVADVDNDGLSEIFIVGNNNSIQAYRYDLTLYWSQPSSGFADGRIANVADFNLDGVPELYQVNEIRDATTGAVLVAGSHSTTTYPSGNSWRNDLNAVPLAIDMFPDAFCADCSGLELVVGHIIYSVDIDDDGDGRHLTEIANMNDATTLPADYQAGGYHPKHSGFGNQTWSATSVVDFNQDGYLDVLIGGTTGSENGPTSVFFWDIQNSEVKMFVAARPGNTIAANQVVFWDLNGGTCDNTAELCTWRRGSGALSVANKDYYG